MGFEKGNRMWANRKDINLSPEEKERLKQKKISEVVSSIAKSAKRTTSKSAKTVTMTQMRAWLGTGEFTGDAIDFMREIYKSPKFPFDVRLEAARFCMRFDKPQLSAVATVNGTSETVIRIMDLRKQLPSGGGETIIDVADEG
jgi:hypothetical protein